ncbi:hypothetical protein D3C74_349650 [compost metagenome]
MGLVAQVITGFPASTVQQLRSLLQIFPGSFKRGSLLMLQCGGQIKLYKLKPFPLSNHPVNDLIQMLQHIKDLDILASSHALC